jgi:hypothetical protein
MKRSRALWLWLFAFGLLAVEAAPLWANAPVPNLAQPKRTGPFRSCGSGMGLGLAGIGMAWGMLWLGNRFARSQRPPSARG